MGEMMWPAVYPLRTRVSRWGRVIAEAPAECEPQCRESDRIHGQLEDAGYKRYLADRARTRNERQCRGCGRWGIFEPRAITANLPNGCPSAAQNGP